jgi:NAD(P)-dependent dehydrogenase (short-subunit alcohol dehydrogenase family)
VLITGASSGVGAALATKLAEMGAAVVVNYSRSAEAASQVVTESKRPGAGKRSRYRQMSRNKPTANDSCATVEHFGSSMCW